MERVEKIAQPGALGETHGLSGGGHQSAAASGNQIHAGDKACAKENAGGRERVGRSPRPRAFRRAATVVRNIFRTVPRGTGKITSGAGKRIENALLGGGLQTVISVAGGVLEVVNGIPNG